MPKRLLLFALTGFFIAASLVPAYAKGRKPDDEEDDKFPDYNRVEMHPKRKDTLPPPETDQPAPPPTSKPSLNTPLNFSPEDDDKPKPPPAAVPVPAGASEPPMPDDMLGTLDNSTTTQK